MTIPADGMNSDIHGSAEYRAHLVGVLARRAVADGGREVSDPSGIDRASVRPRGRAHTAGRVSLSPGIRVFTCRHAGTEDVHCRDKPGDDELD